MPQALRLTQNPRLPVAALWEELAAQVQRWAEHEGVALADAVWLLPYAQLLPLARAALARRGGWQPRVETTATLASSLAPPPLAAAGTLSFDGVQDRLQARALLAAQGWARQWQQRDERGFGQAVAALVATAWQLARAAGQRMPAQRSAFWDAARAALRHPGGPGAQEAGLALAALEWAALSPPPRTDVLFSHRPSAWLLLRAGGADPLADALLAHAQAQGLPTCVLDADPPAGDPLAAFAHAPPPARWLCESLEDEAQATAALVIEALNAGQAPVALVAQDRLLVRRVRALLERQAVPLRDETGWKLSTTRAAAELMALLRAAMPHSGADQRLDWLKSSSLGQQQPRALQRLERAWRRNQGASPAPLGAQQEAQAWWHVAEAHLAPLQAGGSRSLAAWSRLLRDVAQALADLPRWAADAAGAQMLRALRLLDEPDAHGAFAEVAATVHTPLAGFVAWVEAVLEEAVFLPAPAEPGAVVLTPLAQAVLRPFGCVVLPAADARHLAVGDAPPSLLNDAQCQRLGLDHAQARRQRQGLALAQLLRVAPTHFLRRRSDEGELLSPSPWLQGLALARAAAGMPPWPETPWQPPQRSVPAVPQPHPMPSAATALPQRLSASALEALRDCPYRFFGRSVLGLGEIQELEQGLQKRDYGTWLHALLHRFHLDRPGPRGLAGDRSALDTAAAEATVELGLDRAELLPFLASFENLAPAYLAWLHQRDAEGWAWRGGEEELCVAPPALGGTELHGRIDRVDGRGGARPALQVIDYKTTQADALKRRVREPLEDTQLPFYALLLHGAGDAPQPPLQALYLALDSAEAPQEIEHQGVQDSAQTLLEGLAGEWQRLREGAALPALGEGQVCSTCELRGLCRRDDWPADGASP